MAILNALGKWAPVLLWISIWLASETMAEPTKKGTLKQCKQAAAKIEYYTRKRRAGGSAAQMDRWHRLRHLHQQRYSDLQCKNYK